MTEDQTLRITSTDERFSRLARPALALWLVLLLASGEWYPSGEGQLRMYLALILLVVITSLIVIFARPGYGWSTLLGLVVLVADMAVITAYTYLFRGLGDAFYPVVVVFPVVYALAAPKRMALIGTAGVTCAYTIGYWFDRSPDASFALFAMTAAAIPVAGTAVALSRDRQRHQALHAQLAMAENKAMNLELKKRISEVQAISQITEVVHSSLDFEDVGPVVLDILAKVIAVDECSLFVIDTQDSQTLFSATHGMAPADPSSLMGAGGGSDTPEQHFSCFPVYDHDRTTVVFCASAEDVERLSEEDRLVLRAVASELVVAGENSRLYRLSQHLAVTDELTGLPNYRSLQALLDAELARSTRYDRRVSLLMIDADAFKDFNDTQGHVAGDVALLEMAEVIADHVREVDTAARYGGEEFSVVLPETDAAGAFVVAEKIREAIGRHRFPDADGERTCSLTVSIGVATFPVHASDKESLLRSADDALYQAKNGGKDRVRAPRARPRSTPHDVSHADASAAIRDTERTVLDSLADEVPTGD